MKTLILCIDRDNDFGRKAKVPSPIIGRKENLKAALELGLMDPEDADMNAVMRAVSIYDEYIARGRDAEIVTICGDLMVGFYSDRILAEQLDMVLDRVRPDRAIVVSDGAEDEYILPIVTSRIKVSAVERVIIKQSKNLESTYYLIVKTLRDDKILRKFAVPLAIALLVLGVFYVSGYPEIGWGAMAIMVGIYLLLRVFHLEGKMANMVRDLQVGLATGKISLFTSIIAVLILMFGAITAFSHTIGKDMAAEEFTITFIRLILWWFVGAGLIFVIGNAIDSYIREKGSLKIYSILPFSIIALGLIVSLFLDLIEGLLVEKKFYEVFLGVYFFSKLVLLGAVIFVGITIYNYVGGESIAPEAEGWRR